MSYKKLEIWQSARELVIGIHHMTITQLPKFEMFEEGSQIRRSIKSVKSTIVEGYGRRHYKQEFIRFLVYALASCDETIDHLETLYETESLKDQATYKRRWRLSRESSWPSWGLRKSLKYKTGL